MTLATPIGAGIGLLLFLSATLVSGHAQSPTDRAAIESAPPAKPREWRAVANITVSESFDSNVFLQDTTSLAHRQSFVTSVSPLVGAEWTPGPELLVAASYSPEIVRYHAEPTENHNDHRGNLNFVGRLGDASYEVLNSVTWIDGSKTGPTFTGPTGTLGAPSIGGFPIRDRRAAVNLKESFKLQYPIGNWFIRPVSAWYMNDYKTVQSSAAGYLNYADRDDMNGGLDIGYKVIEKTWLVVGYRYGHQDQDAYLGNPLEYSNDYQRFLFGAEGSPLRWLKFSLLAGPELHRFGPNVAAGFRRDQDQLFVDFAATLMLGKADTVKLSANRYTRPGYTGRSELSECLCEATWNHKFDDAWSGSLGFTSYLADYAPVARNDGIYTPTVGLTYQFNNHLSAELRYSFDGTVSEVPATEGREYTRHLTRLGVRYVF
ncbi:MAG: outer membrane beta-barrel protein [Verrucomicrobia bacterium]|nr:outer membrane beta-barrel protein [Verrucomicrobiota bacterium]